MSTTAAQQFAPRPASIHVIAQQYAEQQRPTE